MSPRVSPTRRVWAGPLCKVVAALLVALLACWCVGQYTRDQWQWSQYLYWIPSPVAALAGMAGALLMWRGKSGRWRGTLRVGAVAVGVASLAAIAVTLTTCIGWNSAGARATSGHADKDRVTVLHWNPRVPGTRSLEFGRALSRVEADVILISNPGRMTRPSIAEQWLPKGWTIQDCGPMGLATNLPIESVQVLTFVVHPFEIGHWMVRVHLRTEGGKPLEILCVDLPSGLHLSRPGIAQMVRDALAKHPDLPAPDLIVGDFNNEPGSLVFEAFPASSPPSSNESCGWLCSFPRLLPLWRIDGMRTGKEWRFQEYRTIDLGVGLHRAQLGVVAPRG